MQRKVSVENVLKEKIEYLGLNFERVPKSLIATDNLNFKALKGYDERQYKQYKFIKVSDIDILLTPTHRMDELSERYDKASPLYMYLDSKQEENADKYATFLKMLKKIEIPDVEKIEKEQEMLAKKIPFKVKFNGNYLWQIYYSEYEDKYFMLVPTEDTDYATFFYLLKKKIENKKNSNLFVPVSYLDYSGNILKKSELKDLENYLWMFTKDYPAIYEVTDKKGNETLQIIGETEIFGKIKTLYKNVFESTKDASKFFKLLKALFILQLELPHYYKFNTEINESGELQLYLDGQKVEYESLPDFVLEQYKKSAKLKHETSKETQELKEKLSKLKRESINLEKEYLEKEKTISTYLECKKTFFGKVKYFFTMGKKTKQTMNKRDKKHSDNEENKKEETNKYDGKVENRNYTLDELIISFKELEICENDKKNVVQDINALKLKNKNLSKKIENATSYINEINKHKKSIFEFWKYSNKDEVAALEEGEAEEVNVSKIEKTFNYDNDFEEFGEKIDKVQRIKFTDSELESSYLASTELLNVMNEISDKQTIELSVFSELLKNLKDEKDKSLQEGYEDFDIFGSSRETNKERNLGNKTHREAPRDKYQILGIKKGMKGLELRRVLVDAVKDIRRALKKVNIEEEMYVYRATNNKVTFSGLQMFNLSEEDELNKCFKEYSKSDKIYLYRLKLSKGANLIGISNIILYNNKNMTLPVGMQESNKVLLDINEIDLKEKSTSKLNVKYMENEKNDFSDVLLRNIEVIELED